MNPCDKIFDHKYLDAECVESGCKSLLLIQRARNAERLADKYKWQVRDTCSRAEKAEEQARAWEEAALEARAYARHWVDLANSQIEKNTVLRERLAVFEGDGNRVASDE